MDSGSFEAMVRQMADEIPEEFLAGITEIVVSARTVPHPVRPEVFTLGECIPLAIEGEGAEAVQSRVVLYHGSFRALAAVDPRFDWREEAWETLTHELRHHVEWRARRDDLEAADAASEANFARQDGAPFDPLFFQDGEHHGGGLYRVDHDWFIDHRVHRLPAEVVFPWQGRRYRVAVPAMTSLPAYLAIDGVASPPAGALIVVVRRRPRLTDLFRSSTPSAVSVRAVPLDAEERSSGHGL
jgi:predicted Zn-dependent protease with MMP-like domain